MTKETQNKIKERLFEENRNLFFNRVESPKGVVFELKDEFEELVSKLSLPGILQILNSESNKESNKDVKTIKKWVTFLGIVILVSLILGAISIFSIAGAFASL